MKCLKKIIHRPQIYLGFCALLLSVFLSFGSSQDSYATSGSCTLTFTHNNSSTSSAVYLSSCKSGSWDGFYIKPITISYSLSAGSPSSLDLKYIYQARATFFSLSILGGLQSLSDYDISSYTFYTLPNYWKQLVYNTSNSSSSSSNQLYTVFNTSVSGSVSVTYLYTDDLSSCPEPDPCPPIPENPYDDKLDSIKTAIYSCGASLFVIYFFVCVYKIIVKDGGSRK